MVQFMIVYVQLFDSAVVCVIKRLMNYYGGNSGRGYGYEVMVRACVLLVCKLNCHYYHDDCRMV
jgi:hypothetical protein